MDRKLISYLPGYLQEYREIKVLMQQEQQQAEKAWNSMDKIWANQYINELDNDGCKRWEKMLGYKAKDSFTLEERRKLIASKSLQDRTSVDNVLDGLCGEGGYKVRILGNRMQVRISLGNKNMLQIVLQTLQEMKPAGMVMELIVMYNTHEMLFPYTYKQLKQYTHQQLRDEISLRKE